jgi:hypothetical protein
LACQYRFLAGDKVLGAFDFSPGISQQLSALCILLSIALLNYKSSHETTPSVRAHIIAAFGSASRLQAPINTHAHKGASAHMPARTLCEMHISV